MGKSSQFARQVRKWFRENGLSIAFWFLFFAALTGQVATGYTAFNQRQREHGAAPVGLSEFLATGTFANGIFSNWQAAILQLAVLVIFTSYLRQRGASHSRSSSHSSGKTTKRTPKRGGWLYCHSLSIALCILFVVSLGLHLFEGDKAYNEIQRLNQNAPMSVPQFAVSPEFWFENAQTWEAEFFAIAVFIFLSIYLRQENSPESKPANSSDDETGTVDS